MINYCCMLTGDMQECVTDGDDTFIAALHNGIGSRIFFTVGAKPTVVST